MNTIFDTAVSTAVTVIREGGVILYPTDTVWGLGCNALDEEAIKQIYTIKNRPDSKSLIILLADDKELVNYVAAPDFTLFTFLEQQTKPTTVIYDGALNLPFAAVAPDGSVAIRLTTDPFCRHLIKRLRAPLVSTSANISGEPTPATFADISLHIKDKVDYIVPWRQEEVAPAQPSQIIRWKNGNPIIIRA